MSRIRLVPMIFIVLVSLGILFAGWQAYKRFNLVNPLKSELQAVTGVKTVDVNVGNPSVIKVKLGPVDDLETTYISIVNTVSGALGNSPSLKIVDNRDKALVDTYENLFPYLYQGINNGTYVEMISQFEQRASKAGVQAKVTMDAHSVYVQMTHGDHYLYDVLPLHQGGAAS